MALHWFELKSLLDTNIPSILIISSLLKHTSALKLRLSKISKILPTDINNNGS